jgi:MFS family permease
MPRTRFNRGVFLLEALNSLGTSFYFNYLFFFLRNEYAFSNKQNLLVGALNGFVYVPFALLGGKLGQRIGYLVTLKLGLSIMSVGLIAGALSHSVPALLASMCFWTTGMCFTWPNLEALACDKQSPEKLPAVIGVYNVVWSAASAISYFSGGAVAQALGWRSIFWVPALIHLAQIAIAFGLRSNWHTILTTPLPATTERSHPDGPLFLKLAWLANPFAYIAINATIPLIPDLANRFQLTPTLAGFFCSIWFIARAFTFIVLALWPGWHYRFRYMVGAYLGMLGSFAGMLLLRDLALVIVIQLLFGWCIGLIYYSSLYYSMHVGETKGEHGGFHEAAIGLGIFGGPTIGAASAYIYPHGTQSSIFGVTLAITVGFAALLIVRYKGKRRNPTARGSLMVPEAASGKT